MNDAIREAADFAEQVAQRLDGGQWRTLGRFWRGGWRSTAAWVCVLTLFVNGAVLPLARLFGFAGEPMDWPGIATFITGLSVLAHYRSQDLRKGVTT